ncbi:hypothetical protein SK128_002044, partial [Halocaridina rubra]
MNMFSSFFNGVCVTVNVKWLLKWLSISAAVLAVTSATPTTTATMSEEERIIL